MRSWPLNCLVGQDHLVDAVIVPLVVRRHLIDPLRHAGIGIAGEDGHGPAVVTRALDGVPGRGVARAVVDQVELRIDRDPAPGGAAADLPLVAFPGVGPAVGANRLAQMGGLLGVEQGLGVGAHGVAAPGLLAVGGVVGREPAAHTELAAGHADIDLVLEHHRRRGAGRTLGRVVGHDLPGHLAGLGVEGDQLGVGLVQEDLAVAVGHAAVDRVAAHHRDDVRVLLGLELPDHPAVVVEVERVDGVGERRVDVHHVADHQRAALVTAQHAGREGPGHLEIADIVAVDLGQLAITRVGIVAGRLSPYRRILLEHEKLVVGERQGRQAYGQGGAGSHRSCRQSHRLAS